MDDLKSIAYDYLKRKILSCELLPGQKLNEKEIQDAIGAGRTPVREAILRLAQEDMIVIRPRTGTYIKNISVDAINELYQMRKIIEPTTAIIVKDNIDTSILLDYCDRFKTLNSQEELDFLASNKLDLEFHKYIISCTGNHRLIELFTNMMESVFRLSVYNALKAKNNPFSDTYNEHNAIVQAIIIGDESHIRDAYTNHIAHSQLASIMAARSEFIDNF